jgi:3-oxoacyl-(acyl-carrier-protein) synthase
MNLLISSYCRIHSDPGNIENVIIKTFDNELIEPNDAILLYKYSEIEYPKYFKMDMISKFGILAAEWMFKNNNARNKYQDRDIGVILSNANGSMDTDLEFNKTIESMDNFFPSPAIFVYTLSNIVMGELCIRYKMKGENAFFISEKFDADLLISYATDLLLSGKSEAILTGWIDYINGKPDVLLLFVEKCLDGEMNFNKKNIELLY